MPTFAALLAIGWLPQDWTLGTTYLACAILAGTVIVAQLVLGLFGIGDGDGAGDFDADHDVGGGHDGHDGLPLLSIRAISSALLMFGLVGLAGTRDGWGSTPSLAVAGLAGATTLFLVAWVMKIQMKFDASGTIDAANAVGTTARVYLRIPERNTGKGKVTVEIQGRTAEFDAFTQGAAIQTGARVTIVRLAAPSFFEVVPEKEAT